MHSYIKAFPYGSYTYVFVALICLYFLFTMQLIFFCCTDRQYQHYKKKKKKKKNCKSVPIKHTPQNEYNYSWYFEYSDYSFYISQ